MSIWTWIVGGTAALAAVVAVLYFAGFGGVVRVVAAITGALGDGAQWLRQWLRKPGNKTRGICLVLAVAAMSLGLQSWQRGTVIVQQRADYTALKTKTDADLSAMAKSIRERDDRIAEFKALAARQMKLLEDARNENADAIARAREAQQRAAQSEAKYQEAFNSRTPECATALEVMARACPALKDY